MIGKLNILTGILWCARIFGTIAIAILVYGMIGEVHDFNSNAEIFTFICFPVTVIVGLLIAYKWNALGGFISIAGMIGLHVMRTDLISSLEINAFAIPGLLYIIYAVWSRN